MSAQTVSSERQRPGAEAVPFDLPVGLPPQVKGWLSQVAALTSPDTVRWCDGSSAETDTLYERLVSVRPQALEPRPDPSTTPGADERRAGPLPCASARPASRWDVRAHPDKQRRTLVRLFSGCMRGRVMYAVPYATSGDETTPDLGIELTDSEWVVLNLGLATAVGVPALRRIRAGHRWVATVHSVGYPLLDETGNRRPDVAWPCNPEKWTAAFPDSGDVWSFGTGFGPAALADCTGLTPGGQVL